MEMVPLQQKPSHDDDFTYLSLFCPKNDLVLGKKLKYNGFSAKPINFILDHRRASDSESERDGYLNRETLYQPFSFLHTSRKFAAIIRSLERPCCKSLSLWKSALFGMDFLDEPKEPREWLSWKALQMLNEKDYALCPIHHRSAPLILGKPLIRERLVELSSAMTTNWTPGPQAIFLLDKVHSEVIPDVNFDEARKEMKDLGDGVFKKIFRKGLGEKVQDGNAIAVQYTTYDEDDIVIRDTTLITQEPFVFVLGGDSGVLPAFENAVRTMRDQERAQFLIPRLYFGEPPNEHTRYPNDRQIVFADIEVIRVSVPLRKEEKVQLLINYNHTHRFVENSLDKGCMASNYGFLRAAVYECISSIFVLMNAFVHHPQSNEKRLVMLMKASLSAGKIYTKLGHHEKAFEILYFAAELGEKGARANNSLNGLINLHLCESLRLQKKIVQATVYYNRARKYLGDGDTIRQEWQYLSNAYNLYIDAIAFDKSVGRVIDDVPPPIGKATIPCEDCNNNEEIFKATFDEIVNSFLRSGWMITVFYGMQGENKLNWAEAVVAKYKTIRLSTRTHDQGWVNYTLGKV
ncbi:uncharacterized protein LOC132258302 [Phlebotomus argentipes]|uniref:uncharacterized protein LOC132258302 n=1 Tax=Phlebotomus argentipes TaxID=94469 RepID=UPI002892EE23|nr:uncharacterized protein LOC132258302 [Phlebotomus argentipes]